MSLADAVRASLSAMAQFYAKRPGGANGGRTPMMPAMSDPFAARARLFVAADLAEGAAVPLTGDQVHRLAHVLRLRAGAPVAVFNGRDGEWAATVANLSKGRGGLAVGRRLRVQAAGPDVWLLFAPIKHGPIDWLVEKGTELGAAVLWPVFTRRTVASRVNPERLAVRAVEAAEQCERLTVPELRPATTLDRLLDAWPDGRRLLVLDETGSGAPIAEAAATAAGPAALLVGPEGGLAPEERAALYKRPFVTNVGLGPRILRAETAAVAALACWQALAGDGREKPPPRPGQPRSTGE
jgi:16S rRNA (uracil1498-N3)-methyltransferase